ncbi:DUF1702 family protein [Chloroflexia bacterium SDU3-3]|nr:DUF1702 family protein [Chloroflexia bacterium SDU3-3]
MVTERHGLHDDIDNSWLCFEPVARTLVDFFYEAIDDSRFEVLVPKLNAVEIELRGVAYEGAGMGLMLLDSLFPWKKRFQAFVAGPGASYISLLYIGAGLVMPRMPQRPDPFVAQLDPLLRWFVMDGYGFYEGFFSWRTTVEQQSIPARVTGYARRAFDHGMGRSLWFSTGASIDRIVATIGQFPAERQADLWGGIGLACAYAAGVVDRPTIKALQAAAGPHKAQMAVGAAMAAKFRQQAGGSAPHTDLACEALWGMPGQQVALITDEARSGLPPDGDIPAYEVWRQRIAAQSAEWGEVAELHREVAQ